MLEKGISVFMDVRQSEAGSYPDRVLNILKSCDNMLLILSGNTLSNLSEETDWVRKELLAAKNANVKIIPIIFPEAIVDFDAIPSPIKELNLASLQSIQYSHEHSKLVIEQTIGYLKNSIDHWGCVELLLSSLDAQCKTQGLGAFILGSSEMRMQASSEVHLLTNNLRDYDMTVIAKMTISSNIAKGTKYVYYCPVNCEPDYSELKTGITWYLEKSLVARHEIDRWIRAYYISNAEICIWLNRINKVSLSSIFSDFFSSLCNTCNSSITEKLQGLLTRDLQYGREQVDVSHILDWINGVQKTTSKTKRLISVFKGISETICSSCSAKNDFRLLEWKKNCDFLNQLLIASIWILENNQNSAAVDFLYTIRVDDQIIEWLQSPAKDSKEISDVIKNLFFYELREEMIPVKCCYNFSLLLNPDGSIAAAGWYKASARKIYADSQDVSENVLMIKGLDGRQKGILKKILTRILEQHIEFKQSLNSKLFAE
ncbi:MAG: toll/interleukin-1 receptor domain-containing protein [Candidatus Bathyarchaeota archaeon]|nr:toll/interleukin-1 receptor domain-containing protein [Candidatus Termitimicrobium sp.]